MLPRLWTTPLLVLGLFGSTLPAMAGDIGSDISRGQYTGEGGYFEIGSHLLIGNSPVIGVPKDDNRVKAAVLSWSGRYQRGTGFIEIEDSVSINNSGYMTAGVNLWTNQDWWLDAVISQFHHQFDPDQIAKLKNTALKKRSADLPLGVRATGYIGNTLVQITLLAGDLRDKHDGYSFSAELGRHWQVRKMNYHWLVGAIVDSDQVTEYYFGIDSNQADTNFPLYTTDASYRLFAELGLTLALSEHWVFRSTARYTRLSDEIENSPFIKDAYASVAALTLSYVF